jgi:hypothetical protein
MVRPATETRAGTRSGYSSLATLLLTVLGLTIVPDLQSQTSNSAVIVGAVTRGSAFVQSFGPGFTLRLREQQGTWALDVTHARSGELDLIYPVNPPYRFSNHQFVGPGYGESARDSARATPREFAFLARPDDVSRAWDDIERVLWPYTHSEAEVQHAADELTHFPTGTLRFEILRADFAPCEDHGRQSEECVSGLGFRMTITWPTTVADVDASR